MSIGRSLWLVECQIHQWALMCDPDALGVLVDEKHACCYVAFPCAVSNFFNCDVDLKDIWNASSIQVHGCTPCLLCLLSLPVRTFHEDQEQ